MMEKAELLRLTYVKIAEAEQFPKTE
jgi:hypothetical protein